MTLKLEHCQPFATAVASSGENIRSSGEPDKVESGGLMGRCSTLCGRYSMLYGTGAASKTERWLNRDQSHYASQYSMTEKRLIRN